MSNCGSVGALPPDPGSLGDPVHLEGLGRQMRAPFPDVVSYARASFDEGRWTCLVELWWARRTTPEERSDVAREAVETVKRWLLEHHRAEAEGWAFLARNGRVHRLVPEPWLKRPPLGEEAEAEFDDALRLYRR